jgi:hypothetical protein
MKATCGALLICASSIICLISQLRGFWETSDELLFVSIGFGLMVLIVGIPALVRMTSSFARIATKAGIAVTVISAIAWWMVFPQVRGSLQAQTRYETCKRFERISHAIHEYIDNNKERRLPPAGLRDTHNKLLLSWRVVILPYLGYKDLYLKFRLDQPWDSPHNRALLPFIPEVYCPPGEFDAQEPYSTFCQVFTGPGTAFECPEGCRIDHDFPDGFTNTILLVEGSQPVPWSKPTDVVYAPDKVLPPFGANVTGRYTRFFLM